MRRKTKGKPRGASFQPGAEASTLGRLGARRRWGYCDHCNAYQPRARGRRWAKMTHERTARSPSRRPPGWPSSPRSRPVRRRSARPPRCAGGKRGKRRRSAGPTRAPARRRSRPRARWSGPNGSAAPTSPRASARPAAPTGWPRYDHARAHVLALSPEAASLRRPCPATRRRALCAGRAGARAGAARHDRRGRARAGTRPGTAGPGRAACGGARDAAVLRRQCTFCLLVLSDDDPARLQARQRAHEGRHRDREHESRRWRKPS